MSGAYFSTEIRAKLRAQFKGKKRPPNVCEKIGAAHRGKVISQEQRDKISASLKGRKLSPEECFERRVNERVIKLFKPELYEAKRELCRALAERNRTNPAYWEAREKGQRARWERYYAAKNAPPPTDRWPRIVAMRAKGMTLAAIAAEFGMSHQRVGQILQKVSTKALRDGTGAVAKPERRSA